MRSGRGFSLASRKNVVRTATTGLLGAVFLVTACAAGASMREADGCRLAAFPGARVVPELPVWEPPERGSASLRGTAVDRSSGFALPNTLIFLSPLVADATGALVLHANDSAAVRTGARGGYIVKAVTPGKYQVRAWRASSFAELDTVDLVPNDTVTLSFSLQGYSYCR